MIATPIARSLRFRASGLFKALVFKVYGMPFSRHGLEDGLVPFLPEGEPIALTLDDLVPSAGLGGPIDLLKIDTQGAELHVLRGAATILPRVRFIWVEVSFRALYEGSALFGDVHRFLSARGFRLYSMHHGFRGVDGELLQADALFLSANVPATAP